MRVWLVCLILVAAPVAAEDTLYLTDQAGASGTPATGTQVMQDAIGSRAASITFSSAGQATGSLPVVGPAVAGTTATSQAWTWNGAWNESKALTSDVSVDLWLSGPAPSSATLSLTLLDVAPDGQARILAATEAAITIQGAAAAQQSFLLPVSSVAMMENHTLQLRLSTEGIATAIQLDYGDGASPSAISFSHEPLDSDGDGLTDSQEMRLGSNPLDPGDPMAPTTPAEPRWPPFVAGGLFLAISAAVLVGLLGRHAL